MIVCLDQRTGGGCGAENIDNAQFCASCGRSLRYALMLLNPNTVVGSYSIQRLIGYGGGGAVYKAEDLRTAREVAVKETFDPAGAQSFRDEFRALSQLDHPNLPHYHELFEFQGNGYLAMEFIPGQSLQELLDLVGVLPEEEALDYTRQIGAALIFLHSRTPPILHRDIKPANVRITFEGHLKVVDFGLLKRGGQETRRTIRGVGTPSYAPIEQYASSGQHTDARSDLYSLGALLYRSITGVTPPAATERVAVSPDPLVPVLVANPAVSPHVAVAIERAMWLVQQDRWPSVAAFLAALRAPGTRTPYSQPVASQPKAATPAPVAPRTPAAAARLRTPGPARPPTPKPRTLALVRAIQAHQEGIISLALRNDGELVACGSADDTATIWRVFDGEPVTKLVSHERGVTGLAFTADGAYIATSSIDCSLRFWQVANGQLLQTMQKHEDWALSLAATADGRTLASGGADGVLWMWNMFDGKPIGSVRMGSPIWCLAWSPDGELLASGHEDGCVQIRRRKDGFMVRRIEAHTNIVNGVTWSADGACIASASNDHSGMLWDVIRATPIRSFDTHTGHVTSISCSPDGSMVATGCLDGVLRVFNAADGTLLAQQAAHERGVNTLVWQADSQSLLTGGMDGAIRVWHLT